ncbi:MAG: glycosyl hydrolase family 18 protein [Terracidiphilus sp.]
MRRIAFCGLLCLLWSQTLRAAPLALFYMTNAPGAVRSFLAHSRKIDLLVPAWYSVDEDGVVTGAPNATVLKTAKAEELPVTPIVALFGKDEFHALAQNDAAQERMNDTLRRFARLHGYAGFQIDFEHVDSVDRDLLSAVVARTASALHEAGLQVSIATVPNAPGHPGLGGFSRWMYSEWRGAYDLAALARSVDLICLMTYDQHTRWTEPGPVAGWQWTVENLDYALRFVPREKLLLGIPLYGYHWRTGAPIADPLTGKDQPHLTGGSISSDYALKLAARFGAKPAWDSIDHTEFFWFNRGQLREWVFFTGARGFHDRYQLAADRGIMGFCSWALGQEDPEIWAALPDRKSRQ